MDNINFIKEMKGTERLNQDLGFLAKEVLSFKEALALLDISASMLYKLTHKRAINFYKPSGKLIYFKKEDLINWMLGNKQETCVDVSTQLFENLKLRRA
ncbi:excisionase family DNA binding protein [Flavobacterium sp. 103]|uniref:helix-turn-helix domain-containing protein n=1 Tax=Flavobacterium sp. 103 TaxID=2135624 RepID=UPI000D5D067F|nr:helix-turn-helix domain-containing protein [Flavobacterium sp. 103]PVX46160.1 excisionase family DNA binding protein [Flavobacterium sp. 103]